MKKKQYIKPVVDLFEYASEKGFATSVALEEDIHLIEIGDPNTLRTSEEITEYTDDFGEFTTGEWE